MNHFIVMTVAACLLCGCGDSANKKKDKDGAAASGPCTYNGLRSSEASGWYDEVLYGKTHAAYVAEQVGDGLTAQVELSSHRDRTGGAPADTPTTVELSMSDSCPFCIEANVESEMNITSFTATAGRVVVTAPAAAGTMTVELKDVVLSEIALSSSGREITRTLVEGGKTWCIPSHTITATLETVPCSAQEGRSCAPLGERVVECTSSGTFAVVQDCAATQQICTVSEAGVVACAAP